MRKKVSLSVYKDEIIFRGGFLLTNIMSVQTRTTRDIDITCLSKIYKIEDIKKMMYEIFSTSSECPFVFDIINIKSNMNNRYEPGYGLTISAKFDRIKLNFKIDISCGSLVFPKDIHYKSKGFITDKLIHIQTYPLENIIAEKFETLLDRGYTNGRMRDFYDIYIILSEKEKYGFNDTVYDETLISV